MAGWNVADIRSVLHAGLLDSLQNTGWRANLSPPQVANEAQKRIDFRDCVRPHGHAQMDREHSFELVNTSDPGGLNGEAACLEPPRRPKAGTDTLRISKRRRGHG